MSMLVVFGVTLLAFLLVVGGMAVGVLMGRRSISGSCGGLGQNAEGEGESSCSLCSDPAAACRELGKRMQAGSKDSAHAAATTDSSNCESQTLEQGCGKES